MLDFRILHTLDEQEGARALFDTTWPGEGTQITPNFLQALVHSGSYLAGAFDQNKMVGALFAFPGVDGDGKSFLHSHMMATHFEYRNTGVGYQLKLHQEVWAREAGYPYIGWTFDPLVARNARLNITKLGVDVANYHIDFYGPMPDAINAGDASDRLFVKLHLQKKDGNSDGGYSESAERILVQIPEDIVELRSGNLDQAKNWRMKIRQELEPRINSGWKVIGFTDKREYELIKL